MSQAIAVNSLTQLDKKYSSCPNITLQHEFTIEKPSSIKKPQFLPNMAFGNYEFAIKPPHSSVIATKETCLQKELEVENDRLAIGKEKPNRRSLRKRIKRFFRRMFC